MTDRAERPADCECADWERMVGWSCLACYYAGFDAPAPTGGGA